MTLIRWRMALILGTEDPVNCIIEIRNLEYYLDHINGNKGNTIRNNTNSNCKPIL